ncbi:hypothetical protein CEP52_007639 [Fusarium oligoseptatum]|uniref:chitinase n=1 Tax=Fusarium oligoseptatum TaxID=2604345 RepID=A0A428TLU0_9HYPO|nr:hypothetical protein CEP52_007639 [Fusarium oligoseptatum]
MTLGEIPVDLLTHLNIAFGYIDQEFKITNMDGVPSDLYRDVGNLKAKNPDLKVVIALGGWTFSDPGPWQDVFPKLVSSQANRAIFIKNLLGFLGEFGYDGVDFDWEYPGADDRGGSDKDGANYVSLVKELRSAITSSGKDYIVTFTAPTSYWYLRHFDPKGMEPYVDWINLMSYDLHGVWDSDNPIGSQVLAHSNLTEIDLALDLFWRTGVEPKNIVLGLGFYGRSFKLKSSSCWKPGCRFSGPGDEGPCTGTPGILSYREIQDILSKTGATSYHDKEAEVRYLVYNGDSWISYDDESTFKAKIEYANKMGLSGLMVWAIDQDDNNLSALRARIFPKEYIPANTSDPEYGLITFGSGSNSGAVDPTGSGFGFLLAIGDSHGLTQLRKREGRPEPFVFLDCPENVLEKPVNETQTARVVCTSEDVDGCFRIRENGVEGTLVEMPDECAPNSFARAISLELAQDQSIPDELAKRSTPTSQVFEFSFDFDRLETRDDANIAIRMDVSNVKGYWDRLVDSPGVETRDLETRYFSALNVDWKATFRDDEKFTWDAGTSLGIKMDLSAPVFWQAAEDCPVGDEDYGQGIAAFVDGNVDASMFYAVSVIATSKRGSYTADVKQANGFIKVLGQTDLVFGIGGMGRLDIDQAGQGNPVHKTVPTNWLEGHTVRAGSWWGSLHVNPYIDREYQMATSNSIEGGATVAVDNAATFNGRLTTRVKTDFGNFAATFPDTLDEKDLKLAEKNHKKAEMLVPKDDVLFSGGGETGSLITLGHTLTFGVSLNFEILPLVQGRPSQWTSPTNMEVRSLTSATWKIAKEDETDACAEYSMSYFSQSVSGYKNLKWDDQGVVILFNDPIDLPPACWDKKNSKRQVPESLDNFSNLDTAFSHGLSKRGWDNPKDNFGVMNLRPNDALDLGGNLFMQQHLDQRLGNIDCDNGKCQSCLDVEETRECCGCVCMPCKWDARGDIEECEECQSGSDEGDWPGDILLRRAEDEVDQGTTPNHLYPRVPATIRLSHKPVTVCEEAIQSGIDYRYPAFPAAATKQWDGADGGKYDSISRYWGNASADCTDWSIGKLVVADVLQVGNGVTSRAPYETEHVYEGQLLGQFFSTWLVEGKVTRQLPDPGTTSGKVTCEWVKTWITEPDEDSYPWLDPNNDKKAFSVFQLLQSELGNIAHMDRLTIMLGRLNNKKQNGKDDPDVTLVDEWDKYHRAALDSIVLRARESWDWLYDNRRSKGLPMTGIEAMWRTNRLLNTKANTFHLKKPCRNLPVSAV